MDKVNEAYWRGYHNGYACAMEDNAKLTIVRCKDCKHYWKNNPSDGIPVCLASPKDDAFCSEGERKEDEID